MPDPWIIPFPGQGDANIRLTHQGMGMVIDRWEAIELELARLYSVFMGDPDGAAVNDYGRPRIFAERVLGLRKVGEAHFTQMPDQALEGELARVTMISERFADRRNEVAHGFALPVENMTYFQQQMKLSKARRNHYLVIPPIYTVRKHVGGLPTYAYLVPDDGRTRETPRGALGRDTRFSRSNSSSRCTSQTMLRLTLNVRGSVRSDGTYVQPHYRSDPDTAPSAPSNE